MSRVRTTKINGFFGIAFVIINLVKNILLVPFYLQFVDLGQYGAWLATGGILAQLFITDFGMSTLIIQKSARHYNNNNKELGKVILSGVVASLIVVVILTCLLMYFSLPVTRLIVDEPAFIKVVDDCLRLSILANALGIFALIFNGLHKSFQQPVKAGSMELIAEIVGIAAVIVLFMNGLGIYSIPASIFIRSGLLFLLSISSFYYISSHLSIKYQSPAYSEIKLMFSDSGYLLVNTMAMRLTRRADIFFVGVFLGAEKAGIYSISMRAFEMVNLFLSQFGNSAMPSISSLFGAQALHRLKDVSMKYYSLVGSLSLILFSGVIIFNQAFITLWVGNEYFAGQLFVLLAGMSLFAQSISSIAYDFLLAKGDFKHISTTFLMLAIIYLVLVFSFLKHGLYFAPLIHFAISVLAIVFFWKKFIHEVGIKKMDLAVMVSLLVKSIVPLMLFYVVIVLLIDKMGSWYSFCLAVFLYLFLIGLYSFAVNKETAKSIMKELL